MRILDINANIKETRTDKLYQFLPSPTFGISLSEPGENFFLGGTLMPVSGLAINAGWHFGKVERLTGGFKEGDRIPNLSKGQTFQIPTEKSWRRGFYITVGVEGAAFQRIFLSRLSGAD